MKSSVAKLEHPRTQSAPSPTTLSLVVPVYNEAQHLERWCEALFAFDFGMPTEYVFVDDASSDGSRDVLEKYAQRPGVKLLLQESNRGKGAALAAGIALTTGDIVVIQDADFEYLFSDVPALVAPLVANRADVAYGSRYKGSLLVHRTMHYAVNRLLTLASDLASGLYLTDMETCYKAFRGEIIRNIELVSPRFGVEPELTAKVAALRVRVAEVPISYFPRGYLEGKKIRWTDGVAALWHIARFNFDRQHLTRSLAKVPEQYQVRGRQWL